MHGKFTEPLMLTKVFLPPRIQLCPTVSSLLSKGRETGRNIFFGFRHGPLGVPHATARVLSDFYLLVRAIRSANDVTPLFSYATVKRLIVALIPVILRRICEPFKDDDVLYPDAIHDGSDYILDEMIKGDTTELRLYAMRKWLTWKYRMIKVHVQRRVPTSLPKGVLQQIGLNAAEKMLDNAFQVSVPFECTGIIPREEAQVGCTVTDPSSGGAGVSDIRSQHDTRLGVAVREQHEKTGG